MTKKIMCNCCGKREATCWMDWGEWLCAECARQAIEDDSDD